MNVSYAVPTSVLVRSLFAGASLAAGACLLAHHWLWRGLLIASPWKPGRAGCLLVIRLFTVKLYLPYGWPVRCHVVVATTWLGQFIAKIWRLRERTWLDLRQSHADLDLTWTWDLLHAAGLTHHWTTCNMSVRAGNEFSRELIDSFQPPIRTSVWQDPEAARLILQVFLCAHAV